MALYRASAKDGVAWVTGASSGIGRHLALDLAREGYTVVASARSGDKLDQLADEAAGLTGRIVALPCDATDREAMAAAVERIEREVGPLALAIFNAGSYWPTHGERLDVEHIEKTFAINVVGVANGMVPAAHAMAERGRGQLVLVGSLTSYLGLPSAGAYGASKAALNSLAQALKHDFDKMNIRIQIVNPGFVDTPATEKNEFEMPALVSSEFASQSIRDGIRSGGFEITFPARLAWPLKFVRLLPQPIAHFIVNRATGWNKRPLKPRE